MKGWRKQKNGQVTHHFKFYRGRPNGRDDSHLASALFLARFGGGTEGSPGSRWAPGLSADGINFRHSAPSSWNKLIIFININCMHVLLICVYHFHCFLQPAHLPECPEPVHPAAEATWPG